MDGKNSDVLMGRVASPFGIKGWVKVMSFAEPPENILQYLPWRLRNSKSGTVVRTIETLEGKKHGKGLVVRIAGIQDRDQAEALTGLEIVVDRNQLPEPEEGSYYWSDLEGLQVATAEGVVLGKVDQMLEAGAADVMLVCGTGADNSRHLIPFLRDEIVLKVDLEAGVIQVNWTQDGSSAADGD